MNKTLTFFIIILFIPAYSFSQNPESTSTSIVYGDNLEAHISEYGEIDHYTFEGSEGDIIMIRMRDETKVDAYIKVYDPEGGLIASNWSDGGLAKIKDLELPISGVYTIMAYDRNHNDIGKYGISLHQLSKNDYSKLIVENTTITDSIRQIVGVNTYNFKAYKEDVLFVQMRALTVHLECEFFVYNSQGQEVYKAVNTGRLATVGPVQLENEDTYTIVVNDRGGNDLDLFGLNFMLLNRHENVPQLNCGDNEQSNLNQLVERKTFRLLTEPGQIPLIEARSNNKKLETSLEVYDKHGNLVTKETYTNKLISKLLPISEEPESYLVSIHDRNGNDFGEFGLQIQFLDNSYCPEALSCSNQEEVIQLDGLAQTRLFSLEGMAEENINVTLEEMDSELEPHLRVYNQSGELIAESMGSKFADLSDFVFPENGQYLLLASDRSGNDLGAFNLSAPVAPFGLAITECQTVYSGFEPMSWATITVLGEGTELQYLWNTGETEPQIHVCPPESATYSVTVSNTEGCVSLASTFVEVVDVACKPNKVQICHVDSNNGTKKEKCISENGVWGHLENGLGHEECYIGPCDYISICNEDGNIPHPEEDVELRSNPSQRVANLVFPNPTSNYLNVDFSLTPGTITHIELFDIKGNSILKRLYSDKDQTITISLEELSTPRGIYFIKISGENFEQTEQLVFLK